MDPDLWHLYEMMLHSRLFEELVDELWEAGHISGEMHMGVGEEGIVAGVLDHLLESFPGEASPAGRRATKNTAPRFGVVPEGTGQVALDTQFLSMPRQVGADRTGSQVLNREVKPQNHQHQDSDADVERHTAG